MERGYDRGSGSQGAKIRDSRGATALMGKIAMLRCCLPCSCVWMRAKAEEVAGWDRNAINRGIEEPMWLLGREDVDAYCRPSLAGVAGEELLFMACHGTTSAISYFNRRGKREHELEKRGTGSTIRIFCGPLSKYRHDAMHPQMDAAPKEKGGLYIHICIPPFCRGVNRECIFNIINLWRFPSEIMGAGV